MSALCAEALEAHGGSLPTTVHFVFDEFANIGRIPDFERTIAVTRSRNIAVSMIAQSLSQLKETYGDNNAETIVNACDTLLYLGGKANETNEEISKMAGKQTVASETQSDSRGAGWTRTVNRGISERDLIQPAEVARMPREDALVLVNGCMPLMTGSTGSSATRARACSRRRRAAARSTSRSTAGGRTAHRDGAAEGACLPRRGGGAARNIVN